MPISQMTLMLAANAGQFKQGLADASAAVDGLGDNIARRIPVLDKFIGTLNKVAFGIAAAMGAIDAVAIKAAVDVETPIQNVATVWDEAGQKLNGTFVSLSDVTEQVIGLSTELPQSAASLAEGLYNVASSGFQGSDAMKVLDASARAASAGLTTTETSGRAITAVLNAYGLSADKATDVSDTMFQVVNRGVINFEELSQNMGDIAPLAATAGVAFDEAGSALAAMTLSGLPAAEAATSLSGVMRGLIDPSKEMSAQLTDIGYRSGLTALQQDGLIKVLTNLNDAIGGSSEAWVQLFPDIRAARGAMAATAQDGAILADVAGSITDQTARAGSTQAALAKQSQSLTYQFQILHNTITAIAASFGQALLPAVKTIVGVVESLASVMTAIPAPFMKAAAVVTNLTAALTALGLFLLGKWVAAKLFEVAIQGLTTAMEAANMSTKLLTGTISFLQAASLAATGVMAGLTGSIVLVSQAIANAKQRATELVAELNQKQDFSTIKGINDAVTQNEQALADARKQLEKYKTIGWNPFKDLANNLAFAVDILTPLPNHLADASKAVEAFSKSTEEAKVKQTLMNENLAAFANGSKMTKDEVLALAQTAGIDLTGAFVKTQKALGDAAGGMNATEIAATKLKTVLGTIPTTFTFATAMTQAAQDTQAAQQKAEQATKQAVSARYTTLKDALGREQRTEKDVLAVEVQTRKDALAAEHKDLSDALEDRQRTEQEAFDDESRTQKAALDDQQRTEKEALDDRQRAEKEALAARLKLMDQEADRRKKEEERRWEDEKDQIQFMIDSTFGAERESWKARLTQQEDAHDDRDDAIDADNDKAKQVEKDGLDDRQRQEKDGLDDRQRQEKTSLDDRLRDLKDNLADREQAETDAEALRYQNAQTALDGQTTQLQNNLDDKYQRLSRNLDDRQKAEETAADARYTATQAKQDVSLTQYQKFLDDQTKKAEQFNKDMGMIAARGGADVLDEVAKLPADVVNQFANATPEAFNSFLESIRLALATGSPIAGAISGVAAPRTNTITPGKAQRGFADGAVLRFADGGEYHTAEIAPAGSWRLWAEPETGGEAYIPLAMSKRDRSTSILGKVAENFGLGLVKMANGGIPAGASSGGPGGLSFSMPISIEARVSAGVDPDAVGRAIALHTRRAVDEAFDTLERTVLMKAFRTR